MSLISETGVFVVTPDDINNGKSLLHVMYAMPFDIFRTQWIGLRLETAEQTRKTGQIRRLSHFLFGKKAQKLLFPL